ncbi:hypothetical protein CMO84_07975 [Candidatus Woesearchaeota archaeon]|nr:hypothetical protein [Candidatus Woesearchaeota archaeon]
MCCFRVYSSTLGLSGLPCPLLDFVPWVLPLRAFPPRKEVSMSLLTCLLALPFPLLPAIAQEPQDLHRQDLAAFPQAVIAPDGTPHVRGELLLQFAPAEPATVMRARIEAMGAKVHRELPSLRTLLVRLPEGHSAHVAIDRYRALPGVAHVELNAIGGIGLCATMPTVDTYFADQWQLDNTAANMGTPGADIEARPAWDIEDGDPSVVLAIIDTGIRYANPEFVGRTLQGWDFVNDDNDPFDDHSHGTLVAGLAAASANNAFGVAGVDSQCTILPIKALDAAGSGAVSWLLSSLDFAAQQGADVICMSLINYPASSLIDAALLQCQNAGCIVMACAGNGGIGNADLSYPGASPWSISIGATNSSDVRAGFSGTGSALDFVAPGENTVTISYSGADQMAYFSGCSAATPVAAGIACLLKAQAPTLNHDGAFELLRVGAEDKVGNAQDRVGRDNHYGWGRLNARQSLDPLYERYCKAEPNSTGVGSVITASGNSSVIEGDLRLTASLMPTQVFGYFLVSETKGLIPGAGGSQGNLCLTGTVGRYVQQIKNSGATGSFRIPVNLSAIPIWPNQAILPGETWHFSAWYRDKNPDPTSNFTDAISITFL